jgi:hypothetical protein
MNLKKLLAVAAFAASACLTSTVVSAAPLAPAKDVVRSESANLTQQVHYRRYRHRHHRRHYGYYGYRPGLFIGFGSGRRHWGGGHRHGGRHHH